MTNNIIRSRIKSIVMGLLLTYALLFQYKAVTLSPAVENGGFIARAFSITSQVLNGYGLVHAFICACIIFVVYKTLKHMGRYNFKYGKLIFFIAPIFGILNVLGLCMYHMDKLPNVYGGVYTFWIIIVMLGWTVAFLLAAYWVWYFVEYRLLKASIDNNKGAKCESSKESDRKTESSKNSFWNRLWAWCSSHFFISSAIIIFICWLPWLIIYYPASMDNDVYWQLALYFGKIEQINHHPWFANTILAMFYSLGKQLGSANFGIFLYVLVRDIIMVFIYAAGVNMLRKAGIRKLFYRLVLIYFAITPVWAAYAKHGFKDTFAAALFTYCIISFITLIYKIKKHDDKALSYINFAIAIIASSLFRNNYIYCIIPVSIAMIIFLLIKKVKLYKIGIIILAFACVFGYNQYVYNGLGVKKASSNEMMSLPYQVTARTVKEHKDELTKEEYKAIDDVLSIEGLGEAYNPTVSDPIKGRAKTSFNAASDEWRAWIKTWFKMALEYPESYLAAIIASTYGYYSFTPKLPFGSGNMNSGMTIWNWASSEMFGEEFPELHYENPDLDNAREAMQQWTTVWDNTLFLSLTDVIALYTWLTVLIGWILIRKKKYIYLLPVIMVELLILTCIASPVNDCFRYFAPVAASLPMLLAIFGFINKEQAGAKDDVSEKRKQRKMQSN